MIILEIIEYIIIIMFIWGFIGTLYSIGAILKP